MSENLAKLAKKIDFSRPKNGSEDLQIKKELTESDKSDDETSSKDSLNYPSAVWPWDSVRSKLR